MSKEPFIIINPNANSGRLGKNIEKLLRITKEYIGEFNYALTEKPRHEVELASKAIEDGYKVIAALGGDGTATNIGDVVINHPGVTLGLLSAGSMCDIHRTHSIPYDLENSLEIFAEGYEDKFPAIKCKGDFNYYALDMADGGFTAKAAAAAFTEMKWMKIGAIKYNYLAVKYVLKFKNTPCTITIDDNEPFRVEDLTNAFAAIGDVIAGYDVLPGNPNFSRKNKDLGIVIVHGMKGLRRLQMLLKASSGNHIGMRGIWLTRGNKLVVESEEAPLCWTAEGEVFNENGMRIETERIEDAIRIIVPKDREYTFDYDESIYHQEFEESFKERKIERIK
jgi:diacylglycerol kinase family enzyme